MRGGRSGGRGSMGGGRQSGGGDGYRNPCLTMHQPWASLLVHGIKRVEGRSWPSPVTGRLWIHAAGKVPDPATVAAMEDFYREIHAVNGVTGIEFPKHYPVSRLIGCVDVVGCVRSEELVCWEDVPESVRLEGLTDFCWLCENPQKLVVPFEMRGYQGVYNLERRIYEGAVRGLSPVQGPLPVKFPLPDPRNPFSLKPGAIKFDSLKSTVVNTPSVSAAIAGARAAANQYSRKDSNAATTSSEIGTRNKSRENHVVDSSETGSLPSVVQDSPSSSRKDHNAAAAATSTEFQKRNKSRENRADGSSGSGSLPSIVQDRPSYSTYQDPSPIFLNSPSYSQNQNPPSVVVNSPSYSQNQKSLSTVQDIPSYSQNQNPVSVVGSIPIYSQSQSPPSNVHRIPSYPHNQIPVSIVGSIPIYSHGQNPPSIVHNIPSYSQNQNPPGNVHSSPFYLHNQNLPSIVQNSPSYSHSHNPSPSVQRRPSYLQNHNASLAVQNIPSVLQNQNAEPRRSPRLQSGASNRLVAVALRDLKQSSSCEGREQWVSTNERTNERTNLVQSGLKCCQHKAPMSIRPKTRNLWIRTPRACGDLPLKPLPFGIGKGLNAYKSINQLQKMVS